MYLYMIFRYCINGCLQINTVILITYIDSIYYTLKYTYNTAIEEQHVITIMAMNSVVTSVLCPQILFKEHGGDEMS